MQRGLCGLEQVGRTTGLQLMAGADREAMADAISPEGLRSVLQDDGSLITKCRFLRDGCPFWCRIKVIPNPLDPGTVLLGFRNIDREIRHDMERLETLEQLLQQERELRNMQDSLEKLRRKQFVSQMHPHFLFNALCSIREIVLTDPEYGAELLYDFTTFLRAGIRAMTTDCEIPLSQEIEHIRAYVSIEKMRFGDALRVVFDTEGPDFMIRPFSVQPLVENAIRHGLYEKDPRGGTVTVRARETPEHWLIEVTDDGVGFDTEKIFGEIRDGTRDSTGLQNLFLRLEHLMHARADVQSRPGAGTTVTLRIPRKRA